MKRLYSLIALISVASFSFGQASFWQPIQQTTEHSDEFYHLVTSSDRYFNFDLQQFQDLVARNSSEYILALPMGDNEYVNFKLTINTTMTEGLMEVFPSIRAFNGWAQDGSSTRAKVDVGPNYFRAMIMQPGKEDLFIDPVVFTHKPQREYVLYSKSELRTDKVFSCDVGSIEKGFDKEIPVNFEQEKGYQSCELRTFRVAIAATGEYTQFHQGKTNAMANIVTTLNRVNGVYERDFAVTMTLIANNGDIVYENASTDPYTNGNVMQMLGQNQSNLTSVIGGSNYDIGHVFGKDSGGVASWQSVCSNSNKARGVTGSPSPVGDSFDIDYVAHEMGHQFGANHSFNVSCGGNVWQQTGMEVGGGNMIMGYAGVCTPNVQNYSYAFFHTVSLNEIGSFLSTNSINNCAVRTSLNNSAPLITMPTQTKTINIPKSTPFKLGVEATDADGDELTYTFEQMNNESSTQPPVETSTKGPNFKALMPTVENYRYFPSISNLTSNSPNAFRWERLPGVARTMKFTATVRDNGENGGCPSTVNFNVKVDANSGPFEVIYPSETGIVWDGGTQETVTWDVANTTATPISCDSVKVLISTDSGTTFITLIEKTPNTGSAVITVPNIQTTKALIMVISKEETFFDVSDKFFKINKDPSLSLVEELLVSPIKIYPNPTKGIVTIDLGEYESLNGYVVYDISGKVVLSESDFVYSQHSIDISRFDSGIYFFETVVNGQRFVTKLVKE